MKEIKYTDGIEISCLMSLNPARLKKLKTIKDTEYLSCIFSHQNAEGRAAFYLHNNVFKERNEEYFNLLENVYLEWCELPKELRGKIRPYFYIKGYTNVYFALKSYLTVRIDHMEYLGLRALNEAQTLSITVKETTE